MTASKRKENQVSCFTRFMPVISSRRPGQESHQLRASLGYRCRHFPKHNQNKQARKEKKLTNADSWEIPTLVHYWQECQMMQFLWKIVWRFPKSLTQNSYVAHQSYCGHTFRRTECRDTGTAVPSCADGTTVIVAETWKQFPVPHRMADNKMNPIFTELMEYLSLENEICDTRQLTWTRKALY